VDLIFQIVYLLSSSTSVAKLDRGASSADVRTSKGLCCAISHGKGSLLCTGARQRPVGTAKSSSTRQSLPAHGKEPMHGKDPSYCPCTLSPTLSSPHFSLALSQPHACASQPPAAAA
jgi:hypothetical protein